MFDVLPRIAFYCPSGTMGSAFDINSPAFRFAIAKFTDCTYRFQVRMLTQSLLSDGAPQSDDSDDASSTAPTTTPSNTASVQYMITSEMRKTLENDLGYTVLEVD